MGLMIFRGVGGGVVILAMAEGLRIFTSGLLGYILLNSCSEYCTSLRYQVLTPSAYSIAGPFSLCKLPSLYQDLLLTYSTIPVKFSGT